MTNQHIPTEWMEERFDEIFVRDDGLLEIGKYDRETVISFIKLEITLALQKREEELRGKIESLIQTERFAGAPHALNEVLSLLTH